MNDDLESIAEDGGGAKARPKSPLVNAAERNSKWEAGKGKAKGGKKGCPM